MPRVLRRNGVDVIMDLYGDRLLFAGAVALALVAAHFLRFSGPF